MAAINDIVAAFYGVHMHCVHVFQMALMAWLQHGAALPASIKDMCLRGGGLVVLQKQHL